jgi:toxin-antitoxin system PIN domain toxin
VKLPDVNILLHAANPESPQHPISRAWLEAALASTAGVAFAWVVILGFLRISTKRGAYPHPLAIENALRFVRTCLSSPTARIVHPTEQHEALLERLLLAVGTAGDLTTDAHLAALAIEHDATLTSFDRDFARFEGCASSDCKRKPPSRTAVADATALASPHDTTSSASSRSLREREMHSLALDHRAPIHRQ